MLNWGVVIVAIHLPTKPHTLHPVGNGGVFISGKQKVNKRKYLLNFVISC